MGPFLCWLYTVSCSHIFVIGGACIVDRGYCLYGLLLYHLKCFVIIVYYNVVSVDVCEFSNLKHTDRNSHSTSAYMVLTSVRVLEAKVISLPFWIRAVLRPYSLTSVCITTGFVQS